MKHRKKILVGMLLFTIFLVNMTSPTSAYVYEGHHWNSNYASMQKASSIPSSWSTALTNAQNTWNNVGANFDFSWMISNNKLYYAPLSPNSTIASTSPVYSGEHFSSCSVTFNNNLLWSTSSGGEVGKFDVQNIATHEFGHWLRLNHVSDTEATMYTYAQTNEIKKRTLTSDDEAGILYIYP